MGLKNFTTWRKKEPTKNRLTWRTAQRQKAQGVQTDDKKRRTLELKFKHWSQLERAAALAELAHMQVVTSNAHQVGSANNKRLALKYSKAACQMTGRAIEVQIRKPASKKSAGQFTRTESTGHIQLNPELSAKSIVSTFLHEAAHAMLHWDKIIASKRHLALPETKESTANSPNKPANYDAEEDEANELADKLIACVEFDIDTAQPGYEDLALNYLILHS